MTALLRYDAACRAIAEAKAIDEVKDVRDKADALRLYARQASNRAAEIELAEIRFRAERRIGEMKLELRRAGLIHEGGRPGKTSATTAEVSKIKLADVGIDEKLSVRAERLATIEPNSFEALLARWRALQEKDTHRVSTNLLRQAADSKRKAEQAARTYDGGRIDDLYELIASGRKFGAILADPPWHFVAHSEQGEGRSASRHYTTDRTAAEAIKALPVAQLAACDCALFMWIVDWCPKLALEVVEAWGFSHKTTAFTWAKQTVSGGDWHMGQGYWTRANPEDCWLATRGAPRRIHADVRQLIVAPVMEHSRKPDEIHERIERLVAGPYLELYARRERHGWVTWGEELRRVATATSPATNAVSAIPPTRPGANAGDALLEIPTFLRRGHPDCSRIHQGPSPACRDG